MNNQKDRLDLVIKQVFSKMKELNPKPAKCPDEELLAVYLSGSMTEKERERIEEHLVLCSKCTESLISLSEAESSDPSTDESFSSERMIRRVKDLVKPQETIPLWERVSSWFMVFRPVPVMVATFLILVAVTFGIYNLRKPSEPVPEIPTPIMFNIIARMPSEPLTRGESPDYREVDVRDGGVLRSGDMFRIKFELQEEAYVYLLALDSLGNIARVFPSKDTELPVKVKLHETYVIPKEDEWFRLDENTGQESLYLLASTRPIQNIDQKIDKLRKSGIDKITEIFPGAKIQSFKFRHE